MVRKRPPALSTITAIWYRLNRGGGVHRVRAHRKAECSRARYALANGVDSLAKETATREVWTREASAAGAFAHALGSGRGGK